MSTTLNRGGYPPGVTALPVEPQLSMLDYTMDKIGLGSFFRDELQDVFKAREGEVISFDREALKYDQDGFALEAEYELTAAFRVTLEQDDTPAEVRRKLCDELRTMADKLEAGPVQKRAERMTDRLVNGIVRLIS